MKLDASNEHVLGNDAADSAEERPIERHQSVVDLLDDLLAEFTDGRLTENGLHVTEPSNVPNGRQETSSLLDMIATPVTRNRTSIAENGLFADIDPSSDLGSTVRNKFMELEEISQRLKSRLNQVLLEAGLNTDADAVSDDELERDLDTACSEDLSLQEFLELARTQNTTSK